MYRVASQDDQLQTGGQTEWTGWSDGSPPRELRKLSFVPPDEWREGLQRIRELPITVKDSESCLVWYLLGGEAIVESEFATRKFPELLAPKEYGRIAGRLGWIATSGLPKSALSHAPTPKVRAKVLVRDKGRCRLCGRSPEQDTHAFLEAHHGVPWGDFQSGLTVEENLFTLCNTCHRGVTRHLEVELISVIVDQPVPEAKDEKAQYFDGVRRYRSKILGMLRSMIVPPAK